MTDRGQFILASLNLLSIAISLLAIIISTRSLKWSKKFLQEHKRAAGVRANLEQDV